MVNDLFDWVTIALHSEFGDDYTFYVEDVEQNLKKPCFAVTALEPTIQSKSAVKYYRSTPLVIHYFTSKKDTVNAKKDCYAIAERLWQALEYISSTDKRYQIRGENISWELVEGTLLFYITYGYYVVKQTEQTMMETGTFNGVPMR